MIYEGLIALDFLIPGWEQEYKSSMFWLGVLFCKERSPELRHQTCLAVSVKGKASLFSAGSLSSLPGFHSSSIISQCLRGVQTLPRWLVTVSRE